MATSARRRPPIYHLPFTIYHYFVLSEIFRSVFSAILSVLQLAQTGFLSVLRFCLSAEAYNGSFALERRAAFPAVIFYGYEKNLFWNECKSIDNSDVVTADL
jgi:hypothetical protein